MNALGRVLSWFTRLFTKASRGARSFARLLGGGGLPTFPGAWSQDRAEQVRHYRLWTYVAVKAIAEEIAGQPPRVAFARRPGTSKFKNRLLTKSQRKKSASSLPEGYDLEPAGDDHPLVRLLANPNPPDTSWTFWYRLVMFLELTGNAYIWVLENAFGVPVELWVLPSQWVWPRWNKAQGEGDHLVDYYEIRPYGGSQGAGLRLSADEIIHIQHPGPLTPFDGWSPLAAAAEWVDTAESIDASRWFSFKQGAWPGMVFTLGEQYHDPSDEDIERLRSKLMAIYSGERNAGKILIVPPGVETTPGTNTPGEMAYLESGDQMRDWVMAAHRVGKSIAGITEEVNYASMIAATANFCMRTVKPKLQLVDGILTEKLAPRYDGRLLVYHEDLCPDDPQQKLAEVLGLLDRGCMTPNEAREEYGLEPFAHGGDDPLLPMGTSPIPFGTGDDLDTGDLTAAEAARYDLGQEVAQGDPDQLPQPPDPLAPFRRNGVVSDSHEPPRPR